MSVVINLKNVEDVVFSNSELKKKFPDFKNQFDGYALSRSVPDMRAYGQKMLIDFLSRVTETDIQTLRDFFKDDDVVVEKINPSVAHHFEFGIGEAEEALNSQTILKEFIIAYREKDQLYLSTWR
jgi:hypothetical protein